MLPGRVGEADDHRARFFRADAGGEKVFPFAAAHGLHFDGQAFPAERGVQHAVPHVQGLVHAVDLFGKHPLETDVAQVEPVRVLPDPGRGCAAAFRQAVAFLDGVDAVRVARQGMVFERLFLGVAFRVGEGVPAPFAEGAQRQAVLAEFREGLQAGGVEGEGEGAVAEVEGIERCQRVYAGVVAGHEGVPVDLVRGAGR